MNVFLVFCVTKVPIKHFFILNYNGCFEKNTCVIELWAEIATFFPCISMFRTWKNDILTNHGFQTWVFGSHFLKLTKWVYHFKWNKCQCLIPMIKFELSNKISAWKLYLPWEFDSFQIFKHFFEEIGMNNLELFIITLIKDSFTKLWFS